MSIKFVCSCGKRLKARDDMAERRTVCPRCGNPVGIPSLDPTRPMPMTPAERLRWQARRPITLSHLDELSDVNEEQGVKPDKLEQRPSPTVPRSPGPVPLPTGLNEGGQSAEETFGQASGRVRRLGHSAGGPGHSASENRGSVISTRPLAVPQPRPADPTTVRLKKERKRHRQFTSRYDWPLERGWYQCLRYPFRAWPLILALAFGLMWLTTAAVLLLPRAMTETPWDTFSIITGLVSLVGPILLLGYVFGFLDCVLASAAVGESRHVRWPGLNLGLVFRSLCSWVIAFLSMPAPLAILGFYYWLYCGDVKTVDAIILAELAIFGFGYWMLAVLCVCHTGRLRDANPWCVAKVAERLGWRMLVAAVLAGCLFLGHGVLAFWTTGLLHDQLVLGLLVATACWLSWLYWATVVFRIVGLWWYWKQVGG
jgi:hypothetical protein